MAEVTTMRIRALVLSAALAFAPLGAKAADLVVWWEKGLFPQEDSIRFGILGRRQ
jgi:hypothetical protein